MEWTAISLLDAILEFKGMTPNEDEWTEEELRSNQPRLIRFKRINAVLKAFGLINHKSFRDDVNSVLYGSFIESRNIAEYRETERVIDEHAWRKRTGEFTYREIEWFFRVLMDYKRVTDEVFKANNFLEAGNSGIQAGLEILQPVNDVLRKKLEEIQLDHLISIVIDPAYRKFTEAQLIADFGFPMDDLRAIDIDWT